MPRSMVLPEEEVEARSWSPLSVPRLAKRLMEGSDEAHGRPWVVAVDGRGGSGKSSLAAQLLPHLGPAAVVHTDDLAWHEPFFGWGHLLLQVLEGVHTGRPLSFQPPAWTARGRTGAIEVPSGVRTVVVEGNGASQRLSSHLVDRVVWVQADHVLAEERGIARDVADGTNGDAEQARRFWHEWMAHELPFFASEQPWRRAHVTVAGTPVIPLGDDEVACSFSDPSAP